VDLYDGARHLSQCLIVAPRLLPRRGRAGRAHRQGLTVGRRRPSRSG
jgi:hypothetical protein